MGAFKLVEHYKTRIKHNPSRCPSLSDIYIVTGYAKSTDDPTKLVVLYEKLLKNVDDVDDINSWCRMSDEFNSKVTVLLEDCCLEFRRNELRVPDDADIDGEIGEVDRFTDLTSEDIINVLSALETNLSVHTLHMIGMECASSIITYHNERNYLEFLISRIRDVAEIGHNKMVSSMKTIKGL